MAEVSADLAVLLRCGACLRKVKERGGSILHMEGNGGRVICGEKAVQVWTVVSAEDAAALLEKVSQLENEIEEMVNRGDE